jgi:hypothetical protein
MPQRSISFDQRGCPHRTAADRPSARAAGVRGQACLLADMVQGNANAAAEVLGNAGYGGERGDGRRFLSPGRSGARRDRHGSGRGHRTDPCGRCSPSQASPSTILKVDLSGARSGSEVNGSGDGGFKCHEKRGPHPGHS